MNRKIMFLSEGRMNILQDGRVEALSCTVIEGHKQKLREIKTKNEWKKTGTGARFMGASMLNASPPDDERLHVEDISAAGNGTVAYTFNSGAVGGVYVKHTNSDEPEKYIIVKDKLRFYDLDANDGRIIVSVSDNPLERHLALLDNGLGILTEGDSRDCNPAWSAKDKNLVYYDSCGLGYDSNENFIKYGPRSICRLDVNAGELDEILADDKFDYCLPYEDAHGNLFYIKRPYGTKTHGMSPMDIIFMPFKLLKAIFEWLNFFTQRYTGESLRTTGANPAKSRTKSAEQIFVDGNLIEAEKNLDRNKALGEENPGYAPPDWELILRTPGGGEKVLKKGVLNYRALRDGSILYSNGKYIMRLNGEKTEMMAKAHLAGAVVEIE